MPADFAPKGDLRKRMNDLERELGETKKTVRELKDILRVRDNWHAEIRNWIGRPVVLRTTSKESHPGTLKWVDKYNVAIEFADLKSTTKGKTKTRIFSKGAIEWIEPQE